MTATEKLGHLVLQIVDSSTLCGETFMLCLSVMTCDGSIDPALMRRALVCGVGSIRLMTCRACTNRDVSRHA